MQARLDRVDVFAQFVPVQAQPRLQAQRVARPEPDRQHRVGGQQAARQRLGLKGGDRVKF